MGEHWRHIANTIEPSICGGDAAFLSNYFDNLLILDRIAVLRRRRRNSVVCLLTCLLVTIVGPAKWLNRSLFCLGCGLG